MENQDDDNNELEVLLPRASGDLSISTDEQQKRNDDGYDEAALLRLPEPETQLKSEDEENIEIEQGTKDSTTGELQGERINENRIENECNMTEKTNAANKFEPRNAAEDSKDSASSEGLDLSKSSDSSGLDKNSKTCFTDKNGSLKSRSGDDNSNAKESPLLTELIDNEDSNITSLSCSTGTEALEEKEPGEIEIEEGELVKPRNLTGRKFNQGFMPVSGKSSSAQESLVSKPNIKFTSSIEVQIVSKRVDLPKSPQKENVQPEAQGNKRHSRVFMIEETDSEEIYVTDGNNMVSAKTGRLLETFVSSRKNSKFQLKEPGEIVPSRMDKLRTGQAMPVQPNEDYSWVTRLRDLYRQLKLPGNITAELDQYWKSLDKLDENIAKREVDLIELKGQKKWLVTMLARTLESYPIPSNQYSPQRRQPNPSLKYSPRPGGPKERNIVTPLHHSTLVYGQRFDGRMAARDSRIKRNLIQRGNYPSPKKQRLEAPKPIVKPWVAKPLAAKRMVGGNSQNLGVNSSMAVPPPAHTKSDETPSSTMFTGPPPAHSGERSAYSSLRPQNNSWGFALNDYWTNYFQAYQYEQMAKQIPPQQWAKLGVSDKTKEMMEQYQKYLSDAEAMKERMTSSVNTSPVDEKDQVRRLDFKVPVPVMVAGEDVSQRSLAAAKIEKYFQEISPESSSVPISSTKASPGRGDPKMANLNFCAVCKNPAIHVCSGCTKVWYCSETCQMTGWKTHGKECAKPPR